MPFRPLTIHYSVPTKQWLAVDSATRDIFLADDDVVDDVTSLSWYRSDRCSGSDGAIAIPVDGVGESLNIWQITKLTFTVSHPHVKFVIIPRSLF